MPLLRRLYLPLLLLLVAFNAFRPLEGGDDFWAHAAIGRIVLDTGAVPRETVYLWSAHIPWVFQEWLTGALYAGMLRLGGAGLCLFLNFLLAAAPFYLLWRRAKARAGEVPSLLVALWVFAIIFSQVRWHLRPEGFTILFLTLLLLFLSSPIKPKWTFFAVAGMFALWVNLHAGVAAGVALLWANALVSVFPWGRARDDGGPRWPMFALALACTVIPLLCNPWNVGYLQVYAGTHATAHHINEWRHFWADPPMEKSISWGLCAFWLFALGVWLRDPDRRAVVLAALILAGLLWLQARRQLWLTSAVCSFALAQSAAILRGDALYGALKRSRDAVLDPPMKVIAGVGAVCMIASGFVSAWLQFPSRNRFRAVSISTPIAMSRYLLTQAPQGRLFNDYEYSAALEWFLEGKRPIYIDLINAYPPELFDEWYQIAAASPDGLKVMDKKRIDVVALRPIPPDNPGDPILGLARYLDKAKDWRLLYSGMDGRIWARKKPFGATP